MKKLLLYGVVLLIVFGAFSLCVRIIPVSDSSDSTPDPGTEESVGGESNFKVEVWHDDTRDVTCWIAREREVIDPDHGRIGLAIGLGIQCLPDHKLVP